MLVLFALPGLLIGGDVLALDTTAPSAIPAIEGPELFQQQLVFDISLHELAEIELLFKQLEQRVTQPRAQGELPRIVLVLHGPEVEFFALKNYPQYQELVDLAAKLTAFEVIDIRACQTRMESLGLMGSDMPAFIELVPFGPDEVERLVEENYIRM